MNSLQVFAFFLLLLLLAVKYLKEEQLRCLYSRRRYRNLSFKLQHPSRVSFQEFGLGQLEKLL